jgi:hypothetical protein
VTKKPLLSLSTIVERDTIELASKKFPHGKIYEIANAADFGPVEWAILTRRSEEAQTLLNKTRKTKKDEQRAQDIIDEFVRMIVHGLEPATFRELTKQQRQSIYFAWLIKITGAAEGNAQTGSTKKPPRSTGSK